LEAALSFLAAQLDDYPRNHTERVNLLIHIVAVPVFDLSWVGFVAAVAARSPAGALASVVVAAAAFAAEGRGHALEDAAPVPFSGPRDVVTRIFAEQFITFPRFVLSGGWARAFRAASGKRA
jgi:hypothetical protein